MLQETTSRAVLRGAWTCVGRTTRSPSPLALPFTYSTVFHRLLERMSFAMATRASLSMLSSSTGASTACSQSLRCSFALSRCPDSVPRASSVLNNFCDVRKTPCVKSHSFRDSPPPVASTARASSAASVASLAFSCAHCSRKSETH